MPGHMSEDLPVPPAAASAASASQPQAALHAERVGTAIAALRRGRPVLLESDRTGEALVILALEVGAAATGTEPVRLVLSGHAAASLGFPIPTTATHDPAVAVALTGPAGAELVAALGDAAAPQMPATALPPPEPATTLESAAVALVKLAALLPAVAVRPAGPTDQRAEPPLPGVTEAAIAAYPDATALALERVTEARVPLAVCEDTRIVAFRSATGGGEHLAILLGSPELSGPVLTRVHSACFTGDLLGSLRCDCGDQLRGALAAINAAGGGVLIYLAQEGRGIGLVNKLRAYRLQDSGLDTFEANRRLGFDPDERDYRPAAEILRHLGIARIRLMTNNPDKIEQLQRHGIAVTERVPHRFPASPHSDAYLRAKAEQGGHLF